MTQHTLKLVSPPGQRRWKIIADLKPSSDHLLSMTRWESYKIPKKNPVANIRNMLDPERQSLVQNNREYTKTLLDIIGTFVLKRLRIDDSLNHQKRIPQCNATH